MDSYEPFPNCVKFKDRFGLYHFITRFDQLLPSTLMGLVLGWLCWQTRSVLPGMVLHATYNATFMLLAYYQGVPGATRFHQDELLFWWALAAVPIGLAVAGAVWLFRVRRREWDLGDGNRT